MAKPISEQYYRAFKKSYTKLKDALPISFLLPYLFEAGVVPGDLQENINAIPVRSEKMKYLLNEMESGLRVGVTDQFESFICVMEKFGADNNNIVVKKLAEDIRLNINEAAIQESSLHVSSTNVKIPGIYVYVEFYCLDSLHNFHQ